MDAPKLWWKDRLLEAWAVHETSTHIAPFSSRLRILPSQLHQPLGRLAQFTEEIMVFHFINQLSRLRVTPGWIYILPFYSFLVAVMKSSGRRNVGEEGVLGLAVPGFSGGKVRAPRA